MHFTLSCVLGLLLGICFANHNETKPDCNLPAEPGLCYAYFPMFYYDATSGKCVGFIYGGCGGNNNRFSREEDCMKACGNSSTYETAEEIPDVIVQNEQKPQCNLPAEPGMCYANFPMFYYDAASGKCVGFIYGGCGGNNNRFWKEEDCMEACGNGGTNESAEEQPDVTVQKTSEEIHDVIVQNEAKPDCNLPAEQGMCYANFPMFYYDAASGKCEGFIYGGCGGNNNRFWKEEDCMKACGNGTTFETAEEKPDVIVQNEIKPQCNLPAEAGLCYAYFPMFYYDAASGKCLGFIYGGCGGNNNKFWREEDCMKACGSGSTDETPEEKPDVIVQSTLETDVCNQDNEPGNCSSEFPMYYFNKVSRRCERFLYTGCGGNDNRFSFLYECERTCYKDLDKSSICSLPRDSGPCRASFPRFFFNTETGRCEQFRYGGCRGNHNNFRRKEQCERFCIPSKGITSV